MSKYCFGDIKSGVSLKCVKHACRYHRKAGKKYAPCALIPRDFCPDAFYAAYPYCVALLYGAYGDGKGEKVMVRCPSAEHSLTMEIIKKDAMPAILVRIKEKCLWALRRIGIPIEYPHSKIIIKVSATENCPAGYKEASEFEFNIWRTDELCPAGFHAVFPFLAADGDFPVHCPDPRGIIYEKMQDRS